MPQLFSQMRMFIRELRHSHHYMPVLSELSVGVE